MNPLGWRLGLGEKKKTKNIKIAKILTSFNKKKKKQIKVVNCDSRGN